ncbi:MAG: 2,3-bisphosphoglycerate-independent phosphoglycerate mutase [Bacteroidia bacterium]|nr:2,3-bisphosphoglycerate-independent phosphoglycerate mutase [Bacteroidia bacterium]MDW8236475.1 2,3-bisphosphoglycerate-independent phosphoglycerate mutase [Bacteroidia bacterium]
MKHKVLLIIWDGWGIAENPAVSAVDAACTPFYDHIRQVHPFTRLEASGEAVGLPPGQIGNSEVGHLHIGAGFVLWQDLLRIRRSFQHREVERLPAFQELITYLRQHQRPLHLIGLVSDGGVHSDITHLLAIIELLKSQQITVPVYLHAFTDGRDTPLRSALPHLQRAQAALNELPQGRIASLIGRYYAMDRDRRWERTEKAYRLLVHGEGECFSRIEEAVQTLYSRDISDEFFTPAVIGEPIRIQPGDAVFFFNFRNDRPRQLVQALYTGEIPDTQSGRPPVPMPAHLQPLPLFLLTLTEYDPAFTEKGVRFLFGKIAVEKPLGAIIAQAGLRQLRIAETEKYPHVTYFLNGGREEPFEGEDRILVPSPKVATYDLKPEMSAFEVKDALLARMQEREYDFICLNFANPDMVGHTGVWEAAVRACEVVDACTAEIVELARKQGYIVLLIADHGNADCMRNPDGTPHTAHTLALVPCILIGGDYKLNEGILPQVAPTVLELMGLKAPAEMLPSLIDKG